MMIRAIKLPRRRLAAMGAVAVFVCALVLVTTALGGGPTAAAREVISPKGVRTAEDRLAYLEDYGWLVNQEPLAVEELLIPKEMGSAPPAGRRREPRRSRPPWR